MSGHFHLVFYRVSARFVASYRLLVLLKLAKLVGVFIVILTTWVFYAIIVRSGRVHVPIVRNPPEPMCLNGLLGVLIGRLRSKLSPLYGKLKSIFVRSFSVADLQLNLIYSAVEIVQTNIRN